MEFPFTEMREPRKRAGFEKGEINSLLSMSNLRCFLDMEILSKQLDIQVC